MSIISTQVKDNLIINGDMRVAQRGTSFAAIASQSYHLDRWKYIKAGACAHTITQDTDAPTLAQSGITTQYSLKVDCTTADTSIEAGDLCTLEQIVEGYNIASYVGRNLTLSFWIKATKTGVYSVGFSNLGTDRSYIAEYTISQANTWEKKTIIMPLNFSGGTWNYTNGIGLHIYFVLMAGSQYQASGLNSWKSESTLSSSNQVNACDSTDNNFWLANVKLEPGSIATPFISRRFEDELQLCKRYYQKSYDISVAPGTNTIYGQVFVTNQYPTTSIYYVGYKLPIEMRDRPNVTVYSKAGTLGSANDVDGIEIANATVGYPSTQGWRWMETDSSTSWFLRQFHYVAAAEL